MRSRAIASPVRSPVTASSPIRASKVAARSGERSLLAPAIKAVICAGENRYGVALDAPLGSRPFGGTSVSCSMVARYAAKPRTTVSRFAHQVGLAPAGSVAHPSAASTVTWAMPRSSR